MRKFVLLLASMALAVLLVSGVVWADTFAVKNEKDSGPGSLRAAITSANAQPGSDVITFASSVRGAINLKKALPSLRGPLEIKGPGASKLAVRRSGAAGTSEFRIFNTATDSVVTISGLTISNGLVGSGERGSGAFNRGTLTIRNSTFSNNGGYNTYGGGIYNDRARLKIVDSTFSNNAAQGGGGIINEGALRVEGSTFSGNYVDGVGAGIDSSGDTLTIIDSIFSGNYADGGAGGIDVGHGSRATVEGSRFVGNTATESNGGISNSGTLTVRDSTFFANEARFSTGGGIGSNGTLTVEGSTFSNNKSFYGGGGINNYGNLTVRNSTFFANASDVGFQGDAGGGGIYNRGKTSVVSSTLASNSATGKGGGVYNESPDAADFYLRGTIVARNEAPTGPDASGAFRSGGYNLIEDTSGASGFGATDLTNTRSGLDPRGLRNNGGPTKTIALVSGSPAVDAVPRTVCPPPATDQRGISRPQDGDDDGAARCDIGAYERRAPAQ